MKTKVCGKCAKLIPIELFNIYTSRGKKYVRGFCKFCEKAQKSIYFNGYYIKNKAGQRQRRRDYYYSNHDGQLVYAKKYRQENLKKIADYRKAYQKTDNYANALKKHRTTKKYVRNTVVGNLTRDLGLSRPMAKTLKSFIDIKTLHLISQKQLKT